MAVVKQAIGARNALGFTGLATLLSSNYVRSTSPYDCSVNQPTDVIVEVDVATTNTPSGNKQAVVYIQESLDGTNFRSGPASGTATADEPDLKFLGVVPMFSASNNHMGTFSVASALGYVPKQFHVVIKNDCGVAFTSGNVYTAEVSVTIL